MSSRLKQAGSFSTFDSQVLHVLASMFTVGLSRQNPLDQGSIILPNRTRVAVQQTNQDGQQKLGVLNVLYIT